MVIAGLTVVAAAETPGMELDGGGALGSDIASPAVRTALDELARDWEWVFGQRPAVGGAAGARVVVRLDAALRESESYRIEFRENGAAIAACDELGAIYGIYRFSHEVLGVNPYWFWRDERPARRERVPLPARPLTSRKPTFRYRGWFVNDEDLLTEWKEGSGRRALDYPFYGQVIHREVAERIFETLLRASGNLIIPASFVDVMNEPEAWLVQRAAQRGLYVTQHHIEPLGVSHFGFENFWKARGKKASFSYGNEPENIREAWKAYAAKWRELAGDHVVWQLGLRGKGDQAIWDSDKSVGQAKAGEFISKAIREQYEIVKSVDPRSPPPTTSTLWSEMSRLMSAGTLTFPDGVTLVFCDEGSTQEMQDDFRRFERVPAHGYGVYSHLGFWVRGPHLAAGVSPAHANKVFGQVVAQGDTQYAIVNVANIREHLMGVQACMEMMSDYAGWREEAFWTRYAPAVLHPLYKGWLAAWAVDGKASPFQDGDAFAEMNGMISTLAGGGKAPGLPVKDEELDRAIAALEEVAQAFPADGLAPAQRAFHEVDLQMQAQVLAQYYRCVRALRRAFLDRAALKDADEALSRLLEIRKRAERPPFENWYRGDKKENLPYILKRIRALK